MCETTYSKEYCGRSNDWECLLQGEVFELNCKEGKETFFFGLVVLIVKLFYLVLGKSQQSFFFFYRWCIFILVWKNKSEKNRIRSYKCLTENFEFP